MVIETGAGRTFYFYISDSKKTVFHEPLFDQTIIKIIPVEFAGRVGLIRK